METWPTYARFLMDGAGETPQPNFIRSEMERGPVKARRLNSHARVHLPGQVLFLSQADIAAFDAWYFDTIKEVGWFTFRHPRTGQLVMASIVELGTRVPLAGQYAVASQPVTLEYMR